MILLYLKGQGARYSKETHICLLPAIRLVIVGTMVSKKLKFPRRSHVGRKRPNPGVARGGTWLLGRHFSLDNALDHIVGDIGAEMMLMGGAPLLCLYSILTSCQDPEDGLLCGGHWTTLFLSPVGLH